MNKSKKTEVQDELVMPRCPFCGQAIIADRELVDKKDAEHYAIMQQSLSSLKAVADE